MALPPILDAACGSKMFWFNPDNPQALFVDCRVVDNECIYDSGDGRDVRYLTIKPDVIADFTHLPFCDNTFWHVVFDPPHLKSIGETSWMVKKYGSLPKIWKPVIHDGFAECYRVLKPNGTLIFKWNETQIPVSEVIATIGRQPLYGHRVGKQNKTHWMAFVKTGVPE